MAGAPMDTQARQALRRGCLLKHMVIKVRRLEVHVPGGGRSLALSAPPGRVSYGGQEGSFIRVEGSQLLHLPGV